MFVAGEIPGETVLQAARLQALGIAPHSSRDFTLAHGERVTRRLGTALFEYQGRRGDSLVLFGEEGDAALVGATTLEGFGLVLDPFRRELRALPMLLV